MTERKFTTNNPTLKKLVRVLPWGGEKREAKPKETKSRIFKKLVNTRVYPNKH